MLSVWYAHVRDNHSPHPDLSKEELIELKASDAELIVNSLPEAENPEVQRKPQAKAAEKMTAEKGCGPATPEIPDPAQDHIPDDSDGDSAQAETLVQKTYVKKKVDRLIKEADDDEDEEPTDEVRTAVK